MKIKKIDYESFTQVKSAGDVIEHIRATILVWQQSLQEHKLLMLSQPMIEAKIWTLQSLLNSLVLQDKKMQAWADLKGELRDGNHKVLHPEEYKQLANTQLFTQDQIESDRS